MYLLFILIIKLLSPSVFITHTYVREEGIELYIFFRNVPSLFCYGDILASCIVYEKKQNVTLVTTVIHTPAEQDGSKSGS